MDTFDNVGIVITGGSRGLGRALAHSLGERGARVVLVARGEEELRRTVRELQERDIEAHGIAADVGSKDATYAIAGQAQALLGQIDIVIHNASTLGKPDPNQPLPMLFDTACEDLERTLQVNLVGPFRLTKALAGPMVARNHGTVLHISSDAAVEAYPGWGAYGVSKAALAHLNNIWSAELQRTGVRMISIDPGEMDTDMHREALPDADPTTLQRPEVVARRIVELLLGDEASQPKSDPSKTASMEATQ